MSITRSLTIATTAVVGTVGTIVAAGPAGAVPPEVVEQGGWDDTYVVPAEQFPCGVQVTVHEVGTYRSTFFYDQDGTFARQSLRMVGHTTITSEYGEVVDRWVHGGWFDPEAGTITESGNLINIHGGAGGVLVNTSGRWIEDVETGELVWVAGPHRDGESPEEVAAACAVLAP